MILLITKVIFLYDLLQKRKEFSNDWTIVPFGALEANQNHNGSFRSVIIVLDTFFKLSALRRKINNLHIDQNEINGYRLNTGLLKEEMIAITEQVNLFSIYKCLVSYFRSIRSPMKVFYQLELYARGRLISQAAIKAGNSNVTTYGKRRLPKL